MADVATNEDLRLGGLESPTDNTKILDFSKFGTNPLASIDTKAMIQRNDVMFKEKKIPRKDYELKKLFLRYLNHYAKRWEVMQVYPKQIKQQPAWFYLALNKFGDDELSRDNKKKIKDAFNTLWDYRDRSLPERALSEEESNRQYGTLSPYYTQPEATPVIDESTQLETLPAEYVPSIQPQEDFAPQVAPQTYIPEVQPTPSPTDNDYGVINFTPTKESLLSKYIIPARKTAGIPTPTAGIATSTPSPSLKPPQGEFTMGVTQSAKQSGGSGSGAFNIGRNLFSGLRSKDSLQEIINQRKPNLPVQPVQVQPSETITVAPQPEMMQRKKKVSISGVDRKVGSITTTGLNKFRNIELPNLSKPKLIKSNKGSKIPTYNNVLEKMRVSSKSSPINITTGGNIKTKLNVGKNTVGNMSSDIKRSVGGVVGGINNLKKQVRGEFKGNKALKDINIKNIKSKKSKGHKDMNVLNNLKSQTRGQLSPESLKCNMVPKLRAQCDKVFTKNNITSEVSKFRDEFKDINKMVPTVRGDKAKLNEVSMLGRSIDHGVDGVQVADIRNMYHKSGTTKQMNIGRMEYDYSFVTGKRKHKSPMEEYEEEY